MSEQPTTPIPDLALTADISDGDFRTYVLICHLAWRNHPLAERPYTELGYEELARLHPGNGLTASAVRARIQRLVQAGLLVRERFDNVRWRTYPVIAQPEDDKLGATPDLTQSGLSEMSATPANTQTQPQNGWVLAPITPKSQDEVMGATSANTQVEQQDSWVLSHVTPNCKHEEMGAMPANTQAGLSELGATPANTQVEQQDLWVLAGVAPNCKQKELGAMPANTQAGLSEMGATSASTQPALDLTDLIDPDQINQSNQGGVGGVDLPAVLATLSPEPMSEEGIAECLQQPELTAAWLAYVHEPQNGVQNPAAYLRRQVRRGKYPPLHCGNSLSLPAERRSHERTRTFASDTTQSASFTPALASLAVAPLAATRWPLDAS